MMEIQVNYDHREEDVRALLDVEALARFIMEREGQPDSAEVSINFVEDGVIHVLNREWRGIDRATDVLSFECDGADSEIGTVEIEGEVFELGDVFVAVDVAEKQAPEYGMSFADEMSLLITHGMLHLCGYDHMSEEEARQMESRERELLSEFRGTPFKRSAYDGEL